MFGFVTKFFIFIFAVIIVAIGLLYISIFQNYPLVTQNINLTTKEIDHIKSFVNKNNSSNFVKDQKITTVISEHDVNLLARYTLNKLYNDARSNVKFFTSSSYITATLYKPGNVFGEYLNVSVVIRQFNHSLVVDSLDIGGLSIPKFIAQIILQEAHKNIEKKFPVYRISIKSLADFKLSKQQASIKYVWQPEIIEKLKSRITENLFPNGLRRNIIIYTKLLHKVADSIKEQRPSLSELLRPMFRFAKLRSKENNPIEENRALLISLGAYMLNKDIFELLGDKSHQIFKNKTFYLLDRKDLSQHLLVSAAITALSNPVVAQAIGLEKEFKDSDGGSGFSFSDLAADRAGITFGNLALDTHSKARKIQTRLAKVVYESEYMPNIDSLPNGLKNIDFKLKYSNSESTAYKKVIRLIDKRISACTIYR